MTPDLEQRLPTPRPPTPRQSAPAATVSHRSMSSAENVNPSASTDDSVCHGSVSEGASNDPARAHISDPFEPRDRVLNTQHEHGRPPGARRHIRVRSALFVALLIGGAFAALWPISYRNTATFNVSPRTDFDVPKVRAALLDFLWANAKPEIGEWDVSGLQENRLQLGVYTRGSTQTHIAEQLAREFIRHLHHTISQQTAPTESEAYLQRLLADAQDNLHSASSLIETSPSANGDNPLAQRDDSISERTQLADRYTRAGAAWSQAQQRLEHLTQTGPPTTGVAAEDVLAAAQQADKTLQQDLRELNVRLTELRTELIAATQQSTEKLPPVEDAAAALLALLRGRDESSDPAIAAAISGLETTAANYTNRLQVFTQEFAAAAQTIEAAAADPLRDDLLDAYTHLRKLAADFLFDASKLFTAMRTQIDTLSEGEAATPRNYQFTADLTRAFGTLQSAHHRLEFAAAKIDSANNFRLDSALRSSRGLRSRTRDRLATIRQTLQAEALERDKARYAQDLRDAQAACNTTRAELDAAIADLLRADDAVLASIDPSDQFLEAAIRRELAEATAANHRAQIAQMHEVLDRLAARRNALTAEPIVTLAALETSLAPHDLSRRLTISSLAAAIAFLTLLLGQWLGGPSGWPIPRSGVGSR